MIGLAVVLIEYGCGQITLNLPYALTAMTKVNLRKMFLLIFREAWRNEKTIKTIDAMLLEVSEELKHNWEHASAAFQREYADPKRAAPKIARKINANNKRLWHEVESSKRAYENIQSRIEIWNDVKQKYQYGGY